MPALEERVRTKRKRKAASTVLVVTVAAVMVLPATMARAEVRFEVKDLGTLGGSSSFAYSLNDADPAQVVGASKTAEGDTHAFLWQANKMVDLGTSDSECTYSTAEDVNESGQFIGASCLGAYFGSPPGPGTPATMTTIAPVPQPGPFTGPQVYALNNSGQVAGRADTATNHVHAFVWQGASGPSDLHPGLPECCDDPDLPSIPPDGSEAADINAGGAVAGTAYFSGRQRAVVWPSSGPATYLDEVNPLYRCCDSSAFAINDAGHVVGELSSDTEYGGMLWGDGGRVSLGLFAPAAINNSDQVVGQDYSQDHAVLWENGTLHDLNDLIPVGSGWELKIANDINDRGEIVGNGTIGGELHGFLLTGLATELFDFFALDAPPVTEGGASTRLAANPVAKFTIKRDGTGSESSLHYTTKDGTAKAGKDYKKTSGDITFADNATKKVIKVPILNDNKKEPTENFNLVLSKPENATISDNKGKGTIKDDD